MAKVCGWMAWVVKLYRSESFAKQSSLAKQSKPFAQVFHSTRDWGNLHGECGVAMDPTHLPLVSFHFPMKKSHPASCSSSLWGVRALVVRVFPVDKQAWRNSWPPKHFNVHWNLNELAACWKQCAQSPWLVHEQVSPWSCPSWPCSASRHKVCQKEKAGQSFRVRTSGNSCQALSQTTALRLSMSMVESSMSQAKSTICLMAGLATDSLRCQSCRRGRFWKDTNRKID